MKFPFRDRFPLEVAGREPLPKWVESRRVAQQLLVVMVFLPLVRLVAIHWSKLPSIHLQREMDGSVPGGGDKLGSDTCLLLISNIDFLPISDILTLSNFRCR